jgi:hypothetical protein
MRTVHPQAGASEFLNQAFLHELRRPGCDDHRAICKIDLLKLGSISAFKTATRSNGNYADNRINEPILISDMLDQ